MPQGTKELEELRDRTIKTIQKGLRLIGKLQKQVDELEDVKTAIKMIDFLEEEFAKNPEGWLTIPDLVKRLSKPRRSISRAVKILGRKRCIEINSQGSVRYKPSLGKA